MAIYAILTTAAHGGRAIVDIDREAGRDKFISCLIYYLIVNPSMVILANPFRRGFQQGWGMFHHKNHAAGEANGSIIVGMFVHCVFC